MGRSTIYEYYSSKEQLILVYMERLMNQIMKEC
ncbi:AcrR family transcriptional regulator [Kroppenstedtia sanguinis]